MYNVALQGDENEEESIKEIDGIGKAVDTIEHKITEIEQEVEGIEKVRLHIVKYAATVNLYTITTCTDYCCNNGFFSAPYQAPAMQLPAPPEETTSQHVFLQVELVAGAL